MVEFPLPRLIAGGQFRVCLCFIPCVDNSPQPHLEVSGSGRDLPLLGPGKNLYQYLGKITSFHGSIHMLDC